jgi:glucuronate isomerase
MSTILHPRGGRGRHRMLEYSTAMASLELHHDRLLPSEPGARAIARALYAHIATAPIVSPHGHVDAALLADNQPFANAADLFVTPDHYVTRLLHAVGVSLAALGLRGGTAPATPREVWRTLCEHWDVFVATPSRAWLEAELVEVFRISVAPSAATADSIFDEVAQRLTEPAFAPRALYERFRIEVLATTDDPCSNLDAHRRLGDDPTWHGRVVPTFRPDAYLDPATARWPQRMRLLAETSGTDTGDFHGYLRALESRRAYFIEAGATATDHGAPDAVTWPLDPAELTHLYSEAMSGVISAAGAEAFRRHMLVEMARMSCDDGLTMALHPGVLRGHHQPTAATFGPDTGHDIPTATEYVRGLRPLLERFGTHPNFRLVLFTVDETTFGREIGPLAGFYPSVYVGAPWWFLDTPGALRRFREAVTDSAGFAKTAGFVDDTRAFCSIPARHDVARRVDAGYLATLVAEHRITEDDAFTVIASTVHSLPKRAFKL